MISTEFFCCNQCCSSGTRSVIRLDPYVPVPRELPDPDPNPHSKYRSGSRSGCNYIIIMKKGHLNKKTSFLIVSSLLKNKNDKKSMTTSLVFLQIFGILSHGMQIQICK
jgi:hypothetical protein